MEPYEGSNAASNARITVAIVALFFLVIGVILMIIGFIGEDIGYYSSYREVSWTLVLSGAGCVVTSIIGFVFNALLKGYEQIVLAAEMYMENIEKNKGINTAKKKDSDAKIDYLCQD